MPEPLVPESSYAMIGQVVGTSSGVVYAKEAQRFAAAVGDLNPIYFDDDAARAQGYKGITIPPMFLPQVTQGVTRIDNLTEDGLAAGGNRRDVPLNVHRVMAGGEEIEFLQPVYPGDEITTETKVSAIEEKEGRSGRFVIITREARCTNQDGALVAVITTKSISR